MKLTAGATKKITIDLCNLGTQDDLMVNRYTELSSRWQSKGAPQDVEEEEDKEESQLECHHEFDTQV